MTPISKLCSESGNPKPRVTENPEILRKCRFGGRFKFENRTLFVPGDGAIGGGTLLQCGAQKETANHKTG
jgi:hypothetical protein